MEMAMGITATTVMATLVPVTVMVVLTTAIMVAQPMVTTATDKVMVTPTVIRISLTAHGATTIQTIHHILLTLVIAITKTFRTMAVTFKPLTFH